MGIMGGLGQFLTVLTLITRTVTDINARKTRPYGSFLTELLIPVEYVDRR